MYNSNQLNENYDLVRNFTKMTEYGNQTEIVLEPTEFMYMMVINDSPLHNLSFVVTYS